MTMKKSIGWIAILASIFLGACVSMGPAEVRSVTMPGRNGGTMSIVAHSHRGMPDWMLSTKGLKLDYMVRGNVSQDQLAAVAEAERTCRIYTDTVRPNMAVAAFFDGLLYYGVGYGGLYYGSKAFHGTVARQYGNYGGRATGFIGAGNSIISSGTKTYTFQNCGEGIFNLFPGYDVKVRTNGPQY